MKNSPIKLLLAILIGPFIVWLFSLLKFVLSPPNQGFTDLLFIPICLMGFPICIVLMFQKKLSDWKLLAGLLLSIALPIILFLVARPSYLPSGMSTCELMDSNAANVKYLCIDTSSDDATYHREFIVQGIKGWPIMQITEE